MRAVLFSLVGVAAATLTPDVEAVCNSLYSRSKDKLIWDPLGPKGALTILAAGQYNTATSSYWNAANLKSRPSCAFFPANADDVAFAVGALNDHPSVQFALKSGGHNPNVGWSSTAGGVLIAFRPNAAFVEPSADGTTVDVGAGCKWVDVYSKLDPLGKSAVGGRLGDVGVTGFLLGGGLSYLSAQYGFACDNVLNFECILANGTIVNANATSHTDLFFALKGGGNQYAIVSKVTLKTYDIGDKGTVWGGVRTYTADKHAQLFAAITDFVANGNDSKAAIIPTFNFPAVAAIEIPVVVLFYFYDGRAPPDGVFDKFDSVPYLSSDTKARSYTDVTNEVLAGKYEGLRFQIRENTFPNMPASKMVDFLNDQFSLMTEKAAEISLKELLDIHFFSFATQPMPRGIAAASLKRGGNALGLRPEHGDRIFVEYDAAWASPLCDDACPNYFIDLVKSAHELQATKYGGTPPTHYESGDLDYVSYNPIFMNDAMYDQDPLRSYGDETYQRLKAAHEAYDPHGFFATRQGGWKFI